MITGAASGIGLAAAKLLAARGCSIIGIGRNRERCRAAEKIVNDYAHEYESTGESFSDAAGNEKSQWPVIRYEIADLSSLEEIASLVEHLGSSFDRIDVLINNAGIFASTRSLSKEGYEMQLAVNHLAHFHLTRLLLPLLARSDDPRVISVSSESHRFGRIHWNNLQLEGVYNGVAAYGQSKLANILFVRELERRYRESHGIRSFAVDPGLVNTSIAEKNSRFLVRLVWRIRRKKGRSPEVPADTIAYLASEPGLPETDGHYWHDRRPKNPAEHALNDEDAERLWRISGELCGI